MLQLVGQQGHRYQAMAMLLAGRTRLPSSSCCSKSIDVSGVRAVHDLLVCGLECTLLRLGCLQAAAAQREQEHFNLRPVLELLLC
eukprot:scaffold244081_cov15-Tisochrysis_lutea.AAC.1